VLLDFRTDKLIVGRPARFHIRSRRAASAVLTVSDETGKIYHGYAPPIGFVRITPVSTGAMVACLTLTSRRGKGVFYEWTLEAKAIRPNAAKVSVPGHARVNEAIPVSWKSAGEVTVDVEGCGLKGQRIGQGAGAFVLRPQQAGIIILRFVTTDRYGTAVSTCTIKVEEIQPRISLNHHLVSGKPGRKAVFSWSITDADEAWIEIRGQKLPVQLDDGFEIVIGLEAEDFRLSAKGRGGITPAKMSIVPRFISGLD
jgi:hypothetical protein